MINRLRRFFLKRSIRKRGILMPVVLDSNGYLIDGLHRLSIAHELGIAFPYVIVQTAGRGHMRSEYIDMTLRRVDIEHLH